MPHFHYYSTHSTLNASHIIANADLSKNPACFYICGNEAVERTQILEQLREKPNLTIEYDLNKREIWTKDTHTAMTLIKSKRIKLITWNYQCGWQPLKRGESSPDSKELLEIKSRMLLTFEERNGIVYSGNEKTTYILQTNYDFSNI